MAERFQKLESVIDTVVKNFTEATKTDEPYKLLGRDGNLHWGRLESQLLMDRMRERAAEKFRQKMGQLFEDVKMKEKFEELEKLEVESKKFNEENSIELGFSCSDPKDDVKFHVLGASNSLNSAGTQAEKEFEKQLEESQTILENEQAVFNDLHKVIEQQQSVLKNQNQ